MTGSDLSIALVMPIRLNSERLPQKMLIPISEKPLAAIALSKIREAAERFRQDALAAICPLDAPLIDIANRVGVPVFARSEESRNGETIATIYGGWREQLSEYDWMIWVNPCMPFLTIDTIGKAIDACHNSHGSVTSVFQLRGNVWNEHQTLIYGAECANSKTNPIFHIYAHAFHCMPIEFVGQPEMHQFVKLCPLTPGYEFLDIDTHDDLESVQVFRAGLSSLGEEASRAQHAQGNSV